MAGPGPKSTRVMYGDGGGAKSSDKQTGSGRAPGDVASAATNAKVPVDGVKDVGTHQTSKAAPSTRPTTGGKGK